MKKYGIEVNGSLYKVNGKLAITDKQEKAQEKAQELLLAGNSEEVRVVELEIKEGNSPIVTVKKRYPVLDREAIVKEQEEEEISKLSEELGIEVEFTNEARGAMLSLLRELKQKRDLVQKLSSQERERKVFLEKEGEEFEKRKREWKEINDEIKRLEEKREDIKHKIHQWINSKVVKYPNLREWIESEIGISEVKMSTSKTVRRGTWKEKILLLLQQRRGERFKESELARIFSLPRGAHLNPYLRELRETGQIYRDGEGRYYLP